jgi:hypothetical protein
LKEEYSRAVDIWKASKFTDSDVEYYMHLKEKLSETDIMLKSAKLNGPETKIIEFEEKKTLYHSLLHPFQLLEIDSNEVYRPVCIGLIGNWPFYGFYRDWIVYISQQFVGGVSFIPLERYVFTRNNCQSILRY